jgi:replicative DNA helicase
LDKLLGGFSAATFSSSPPGVGKTSLMLSMGLNAARKFHQRVAVFSLEMSAEQVVQRLISQETGIDSQRLRLGEIHEDEWDRFIRATSDLSTPFSTLTTRVRPSTLQPHQGPPRPRRAWAGLIIIVISN